MQTDNQKKFFFISNNTILPPFDSGLTLSGGDRIFVELARNWKNRASVSVVGCQEAILLCKREGLIDIDYYETSPHLHLKNIFSLKAIFLNFLKKLAGGISFVLKNKQIFSGKCFVYSASDFYPDSFPAFLVKLMNKQAVWIAAFYLFAPLPWQKDNPYKGKDALRGFLYWLSQRPMYWLIRSCADLVFVTSEPDRAKFVTKKRGLSKVIAVRGGVNTEPSTRYLNNGSLIPVEDRKYDACFIGRFHQQKGILELVAIWHRVVQRKPDSRLAMIGYGPLEGEAKKKARESGIEEKIDFFGFLDGDAKFNIFKHSKLVVHPATFDSGGMAAAEAMAWSLPGVSFDLESLKSYYPKGMVKVPLNDLDSFAEEILNLLNSGEHYAAISRQARDLIVQEWDWKKRSEDIYASIFIT